MRSSDLAWDLIQYSILESGWFSREILRLAVFGGERCGRWCFLSLPAGKVETWWFILDLYFVMYASVFFRARINFPMIGSPERLFFPDPPGFGSFRRYTTHTPNKLLQHMLQLSYFFLPFCDTAIVEYRGSRLFVIEVCNAERKYAPFSACSQCLNLIRTGSFLFVVHVAVSQPDGSIPRTKNLM